MKITTIFLLFLFVSCSTIKYSKEVEKPLPELASIGDFRSFLLNASNNSTSIPTLEKPIRLSMTKTAVVERNWFRDKENKKSLDSTLVGLEIIDKLGLIHEFNSDKSIIEYLKMSSSDDVVTGVTINFPRNVENQINLADEIYLVQNKEKTLSIEMRQKNKATGTVEFADGKIVDIKTSSFCWGKGDRGQIVITDLRKSGEACVSGTYTSPQKAKKKTEFKF